MGGKQSSEVASPQNPDNSSSVTASSQPNTVGSSRHRNTVALTTTNRHSSGQSSRNRTREERPNRHGRHQRSSSTREHGIRIARPGFEWFFANQLREDDSSADENASSSRNSSHPLTHRGNLSRSLPVHLFRSNRDAKCPMCHKMIPAEDVEVHFVMCLTKPRVTYNDDVMVGTGGECSICLEDLEEGEAIARLPCLCVYHKACIDKWFLKSQTCPEHPPD